MTAKFPKKMPRTPCQINLILISRFVCSAVVFIESKHWCFILLLNQRKWFRGETSIVICLVWWNIFKTNFPQPIETSWLIDNVIWQEVIPENVVNTSETQKTKPMQLHNFLFKGMYFAISYMLNTNINV